MNRLCSKALWEKLDPNFIVAPTKFTSFRGVAVDLTLAHDGEELDMERILTNFLIVLPSNLIFQKNHTKIDLFY